MNDVPLPECIDGDIGAFLPSEIKAAVRAYGDACAAAERARTIEECAKVCDDFDPYDSDTGRVRFDQYKSGADAASVLLAELIRALAAKGE
jgi:hypothetical protein